VCFASNSRAQIEHVNEKGLIQVKPTTMASHIVDRSKRERVLIE
jgi:hypothetical protein